MAMLESATLFLSSICALPRNPKRHDLGTIGASIGRWGFVDRMLVNRETNHLLSGHGRVDALLALRASGAAAPPGIEAIGPDWLVPIDYVSVPAADEEALSVALNRTVELGGWDDAALAEVLRDLAATPGGLDGVGFGESDLDALLRGLTGPSLGPELDESLADGVSLCVCPVCGHEHSRRMK